jgi:hypothetical protein
LKKDSGSDNLDGQKQQQQQQKKLHRYINFNKAAKTPLF